MMQELEPDHSHLVQLKHLERKEASDDRKDTEKLQGKMGAPEDGNRTVWPTFFSFLYLANLMWKSNICL